MCLKLNICPFDFSPSYANHFSTIVDLLLSMRRDEYLGKVPYGLVSYGVTPNKQVSKECHVPGEVDSRKVSLVSVPYKGVQPIKLSKFMVDDLCVPLPKFYSFHVLENLSNLMMEGANSCLLPMFDMREETQQILRTPCHALCAP